MITNAFQDWNIEYIPVRAGVGIFAKVLKNAETWEEEDVVVQKLLENGVSLGGGKSWGGIDGEKGWIRMTFSVPEDVMREVILRMGKVFKSAE